MNIKSHVLLILFGSIFLTLCAQGNCLGRDNTRVVPTTLDPVYAAFPTHRIDDRIHVISIVGSGPGYEEIASALTKFFVERTDIKVVEPGNLQSVLAGKIIEYRTGVATSDAQLLSRMLQIDHLVLFDVESAPWADYRFGGRNYALINLKIIDTKNGEVLFQTSRNIGARMEDPRKYGYTQINQSDAPREWRAAAYTSLIHEMRYALGDVSLGWVLKPSTNVVSTVLVGSLADRAGIRKGDTIVGINDTSISSDLDIVPLFAKGKREQGDEIVVKIERDGKVLEQRIRYPVVPFLPRRKWENEMGKGVGESPDQESKTLNF